MCMRVFTLTLQIHIEMERTEEVDDYGNASVGVIWKEGQSEHVVERVVGGGPAAPRKGDRLLKIDGQVRFRASPSSLLSGQ